MKKRRKVLKTPRGTHKAKSNAVSNALVYLDNRLYDLEELTDKLKKERDELRTEAAGLLHERLTRTDGEFKNNLLLAMGKTNPDHTSTQVATVVSLISSMETIEQVKTYCESIKACFTNKIFQQNDATANQSTA